MCKGVANEAWVVEGGASRQTMSWEVCRHHGASPRCGESDTLKQNLTQNYRITPFLEENT